MARFRAVDPSAPQAKGRQPIRKDDGGAMAVDRFGEDAWAMVHAGDGREESSATSSHAVEAAIKQDEPDEPVAVPTPIGCWKVISPDGREERVFRPIPGFEHLCNGPATAQGLPFLADAPKATPTSIYQTAVTQGPATSDEVETKKRKRTRLHPRGPGRTIGQHLSDDGDDELYDSKDATVATEKSYTFFIGDVKGLERFFRRRLDELTMKPVRPIVTAWVKLREPKRLSLYGPYHKKLAKDMPQGCTPPWWPQDVPYEEPSHLDKTGLLTLAVDLLFQHRPMDAAKRTPNRRWVHELKRTAEYAVETTPPDQFSSSKGSAFSERMQDRALKEILPNLFDVAQTHEDHLWRYNFYEGTNIQDLQIGTHVTWQPLTRPPRQAPLPRKRFRRAGATPPSRIEPNADLSGNETEVDNTATASHLPREEKTRKPPASRQRVPGPSHGPVDSLPVPIHPHSSATTPNTSFGQSMQGLHLDENMDMDVKVANHAPYHDQISGHNNLHCSQPMQYCASHTGFHHVPQHQQHLGPPHAASVSIPGYHHPFTMFEAPYHAQTEGTVFSNSPAFPHDYDMFAPAFFDGLPHLPSIGGELEGSRH